MNEFRDTTCYMLFVFMPWQFQPCVLLCFRADGDGRCTEAIDNWNNEALRLHLPNRLIYSHKTQRIPLWTVPITATTSLSRSFCSSATEWKSTNHSPSSHLHTDIKWISSKLKALVLWIVRFNWPSPGSLQIQVDETRLCFRILVWLLPHLDRRNPQPRFGQMISICFLPCLAMPFDIVLDLTTYANREMLRVCS